MKKNVYTFFEFINEQEKKEISIELPKGVLFNSPSRTAKKGTFAVTLNDDGELKIEYDTDKKIANLIFTKEKVSYGDFDVKGEGVARAYTSGTDERKGGKPQMDPKATAGILLEQFLAFSNQFSENSSAYMDTLCKILRALSVGEKYKTKTPASFKKFMGGIYTSFKTDVFASVKEDEKTNKHKDIASKFKNSMEAAIKEMPSKKA
jgi:hypothetical protein